MLQSSLLITRRRGDSIKPVFAPITRNNLDIAETIISLFSDCLGKKKVVLNNEFQVLEESLGGDYRFLRGLFALLERRTVIEQPVTRQDPFHLRQVVFEIAEETSSRDAALEEASTRLGIPRKELEEGLWADEDDELLIKEFESVTPLELLSQYNLSLLQTMLFKASVLEVSFEFSVPMLKELLRRVRFYGLMYDTSRSHDRIQLTVNGPISILKMTKKYGTSLAKFIPYAVKTSNWQLKASILEGDRILEFSLLEKEFKEHYQGISEASAEHARGVFDSAVEEDFYNQFTSLRTNWVLKREPEPLIKDSVVMIPDFSFEGYNKKVFMEIMGFWTPEYLKKKLDKLKLFPHVLLCINEELGSTRSLGLENQNTIFYKKNIPLNKILKILRDYEVEQISKELEIIENKFKTPTTPFVTLDELSTEINVSQEAIKKFLQQRNMKGYVFTGNLLVAKELMGEISSELDKLVGKKNYSQALSVIRGFIPRHEGEVFNALGFTIDWASLNTNNAVIKRKS